MMPQSPKLSNPAGNVLPGMRDEILIGRRCTKQLDVLASLLAFPVMLKLDPLSWSRTSRLLGRAEKYSPLTAMAGRVVYFCWRCLIQNVHAGDRPRGKAH